LLALKDVEPDEVTNGFTGINSDNELEKKR
jgi:hypothetical protein